MFKEGSSQKDSALFQILQQPPQYVLFDKWFEIEIKIDKSIPKFSTETNEDNENEPTEDLSKPSFIDIGLKISQTTKQLQVQDDSNEGLPTLITEPSLPIRLAGNESQSSAKIKLKLKRASQSPMPIDTSFVINLHATNMEVIDDPPTNSIFTRPFKLALYTLNIEAEDWKDIWYKDEGGREKCMHIIASLRDNKDNIIKDRKIPLKLTLMYQNEQHLEVMRQEILHVFGPSKHEISDITGSTSLRFRIEDVSKNHQGQNFIVQIREDGVDYNGIAPAYSPSVSIRSKRNKRQRVSNGKNDATYIQRSSEMFGGINRSRSPFSTESGTIGQDFDQPFSLEFPGFREQQDVQRLREAMKGVVKWTEEVVNGLYPLQWQIVGYSPNLDGTFDYSRPYHTMSNPNSCISKILSMYSESTREHLSVLIDAVENTRPDLDMRMHNTLLPNANVMPDENIHHMATPPYRQVSQASYADRGKPMTFEDQMSNGQFTPHNPYPKLDTHNIFEPPWANQYSPTKLNMAQMKANGNITHKPPNESHTIVGIQNSQHGHGQDFTRSYMDMDNSQMMLYPLQSMQHNEHGKRRDSRIGPSTIRHSGEEIDVDNRQAEVTFVLAIEYVSMRSGNKLGFPAYTNKKELIGFYKEAKAKTGSAMFIPISRLNHEIGSLEMEQATQRLNDHIGRKSEAVYAIEDWGTVRNLVDHAMVYDWNNNVENQRKSSDHISRGYM